MVEKGHIPWNKGKTGIYSKESLEKMAKAKIGKTSWNQGKKHSEESKRKNSESHKGKKPSEEARKNMSEAGKRKIFFSEHRRNIAESKKGEKNSMYGKPSWNKGKKMSKESKEKLLKSGTLFKKGQIPHNKGVPLPEEDKRKLSEIHSSEKTRQKHRESRLKQVFPTKDSKPEKIIQTLLSLHGIEFQKHVALAGQPDIFIEPNICVFIDGKRHHADPRLYSSDAIIWNPHRNNPTITAKDIWKKDDSVNQKLEKQGFRVKRFWEIDIIKDAKDCVNEILEIINNPRSIQTL